MPGTQDLQDNFIIDTQIIQNFAHLPYSNMNRSCFGNPLNCVICAKIDSSQDYVFQADLSWHQITLGMSTCNKIYSLYKLTYFRLKRCSVVFLLCNVLLRYSNRAYTIFQKSRICSFQEEMVNDFQVLELLWEETETGNRFNIHVQCTCSYIKFTNTALSPPPPSYFYIRPCMYYLPLKVKLKCITLRLIC